MVDTNNNNTTNNNCLYIEKVEDGGGVVRTTTTSDLSGLTKSSSSLRPTLRLDNNSENAKSFSHRGQRRVTYLCEDDLFQTEQPMNQLRLSLGLYKNYPLAHKMLKGADSRERRLKANGRKQTDHIKGTDGWMKSMCALEERCIDNVMAPLVFVCLNALLCTLLHKIGGIKFDHAAIKHWDSVYSLVLKTSLAFLLVFRLNRCAVRFWEVRTMWGGVTLSSRSLVSGIITHCGHSPENRDKAICWTGAFCVAAMHFIRREREIPSCELKGFLSPSEIDKMQDAKHPPLYVTSQIRYFLRKALCNNVASLSVQEAHARTVHMNYLCEKIDNLISQVSGMERIRSTPLPVVYVSHLRTFLFIYLLFLPYLWVTEWGWGTLPLVWFTGFALFGIEGASSEVEIPFDKNRCNHLALDAYCVTILDNIQGLVIHEANIDIQSSLESDSDGEEDESDDDDSQNNENSC